MKGSTRAAMALGVGYLLGRHHKLRTATVMAVATAAGGTNVGSLVMRRGAKMLVNSGVMDKVPPQVGDLVEVVRGDLLQAGKGAASAAVSSRIDSLTDSLHDRAERLRNPEAVVAEGADAAGKAAGGAGKAAGGAGKAASGAAKGAAKAGRGAAGSATRRLRGRGREDEDADEAAEEPVDDEAYADEAAEDEDEYADDEYADDEYDEDEPEERDEPAPRRRGRAPVSRTRR